MLEEGQHQEHSKRENGGGHGGRWYVLLLLLALRCRRLLGLFPSECPGCGYGSLDLSTAAFKKVSYRACDAISVDNMLTGARFSSDRSHVDRCSQHQVDLGLISLGTPIESASLGAGSERLDGFVWSGTFLLWEFVSSTKYTYVVVTSSVDPVRLGSPQIHLVRASGLRIRTPRNAGPARFVTSEHKPRPFDMVLAAVGQLCSKAVVEANLAQCRSIVRRAAAAGAKLVMLPEASDFIADAASVMKLTRPLGESPFVDGIKSAAKAGSVWVGVGVHESSDDPKRCYNTNILVNPQGEIVQAYRKVRPRQALLGR